MIVIDGTMIVVDDVMINVIMNNILVDNDYIMVFLW